DVSSHFLGAIPRPRYTIRHVSSTRPRQEPAHADRKPTVRPRGPLAAIAPGRPDHHARGAVPRLPRDVLPGPPRPRGDGSPRRGPAPRTAGRRSARAALVRPPRAWLRTRRRDRPRRHGRRLPSPRPRPEP